MSDLFEAAGDRDRLRSAPLAERMRPRALDEVVGQDRLLGPGRLLREMTAAERLPSLLLWGPPGSGKTTLARLLAEAAGLEWHPLSAVSSGVKDLRAAVAAAEDAWNHHRRRTALFIDEIHRFNKAQQDALLPHVERGTVVFLGATTENPSFEVVAPLLSRARVVVLEPLSDDAIRVIVDRALADADRGLGLDVGFLDDDARDFIVRTAGGDARRALGALEVAVDLAARRGASAIDVELIEEATQQRWLGHDRAGDAHFDVISAFIKSLRDSDPDAALYWCFRMIEAGEDPLYLARRMVVFAAEDVGTADPRALVIANAVKDAVHFTGLPEAKIPLAMGVTYLATAPRSNASYAAMRRAIADVHEHGALPVPPGIRNAPTALARELGHGKGYQYAHDAPDAWVDQPHRPEPLEGRVYYEPGERGDEAEIRERMEAKRRALERNRRGS